MYYLPALSINAFIQTLADSGSALMGEKKTTLCNVLFCVKHTDWKIKVVGIIIFNLSTISSPLSADGIVRST